MELQDKIKGIEEFFNQLTFVEKTHKYYVGDDKIKYSVSGLIHKFVEHVDFDEIAEKKDRELGLPVGSHKQMWKYNAESACALGTKVHFFGELYPFCKELEPTNPQEEAIVKFWNDLPEHIVPAKMELQMYHKEYMFAGTADILLYDTKKDVFHIADYKTNKDLFKNFADKRMLAPFDDLQDSPISHYGLQLSFYQILFEQTGHKVESRKIVWLKNDGSYELYPLKDYTNELREQLKNGLSW